MGLLINYNVDNPEWAQTKTLTIEYPEGNYEYYLELESGSAKLNDKELTIGEEIKVENSVDILLTENSVISTWLMKDNKKISLRKYVETKIDNVELNAPEIITTGGYPTISPEDVKISTSLKINYDEKVGSTPYYSVDDGKTWNKYTEEVLVESLKIKAKIVRDSGRESEISEKVVTTATDAITSEAYDGDESTFMEYHITKNGISFDKSTLDKYMLVDSKLWEKFISVKWYSWYFGGYISYIEFKNSSDETLSQYNLSGGKTETIDLYVPKGTTKIKYYMNKISDLSWSTNGKMFEIKPTNKCLVTLDDLPIFATIDSSGVKKTLYNEINMDIKNASVRYKIADESYKNYNSEVIKLSSGKTLEYEYTNKSTSEKITKEYTSVDLSADSNVFEKAYDGDKSTAISGTKLSTLNKRIIYLKIADDMKGKTLNIKWGDNNSSDIIYHVFLDKNKNEISNTRKQPNNLQTLDSVYNIPEDAEYLKFYIGISCNVYEISIPQ